MPDMKLLVLYPDNPKNHVLYIKQFVDALAKYGHTVYGPGRDNYGAYMVANRGYVVLSELAQGHDAVVVFEPKFSRWMLDHVRISDFRELAIPKICVLSDYFPYKNQMDLTNQFLDTFPFDIAVTQTSYEQKLFSRRGRGERQAFLPMSVDMDFFRIHSRVWWGREIDICGMWNHKAEIYPGRAELLRYVSKMGEQYNVWTRHTFHENYAITLGSSKLFVNQGTVFGNFQPRFLEAAAAGCPMLSDAHEDMDIYGRYFFKYKDFADLKKILPEILADEKQLTEMADLALLFARQFTHGENERRLKEIIIM